MSDHENGSVVTGNLSSKNASEDLSTADAFSLPSKQLDNTLQQQKKEIFNVLEAKIPAPPVDTSKKEFNFKYISNKNQCDFNESVSKDLSRIKSAVTAGNLPDALHLLDNSQQEIAASNKKVKIGDRYGWDTVSEHEGNPLADDSDDERRLRQTETRAIRKRKDSFPKEPPKRFAADKLFRGFSQPPVRQNVNTAANSQTTRRYFGNRSSTYQPQIGRKFRAQDTCYYSGAVGHWSLNCPEKKTEKRSTSSK
jgi:hypothetical protein